MVGGDRGLGRGVVLQRSHNDGARSGTGRVRSDTGRGLVVQVHVRYGKVFPSGTRCPSKISGSWRWWPLGRVPSIIYCVSRYGWQVVQYSVSAGQANADRWSLLTAVGPWAQEWSRQSRSLKAQFVKF